MITPTKPWSRPNCRHAYGLDISKVGVWPNKKYVAMCHICMLQSSPQENTTDAREDVWRTTLAAERRETEKIATRCNHEGYVVLMRDWTAWDMCEAELYYGLCYNCKMRGPNAMSAYRAGQLFKEKTLRDFQLLENPILETRAKHTVNATEKPRSTAFSPILGMPYGAQTAASAGILTSAPALTHDAFNQMYRQLQEALVPTQTEKPYWIIVSDEGHANIPHKHFVKAEAEKEAQRLTELKPGITFTVFEAKSSVFTPKADTKKTVYADLPPIYYDPFVYFYGKNMVKV